MSSNGIGVIVAGVSMVKDEADVIEHTIRHLLDEGVDEFVIADNNSTDGTRDILADLARETKRVDVVEDPDPAYYQSDKMSRLASRAAFERDAEWIVPFDADEVWVGPDRIGGLLRGLGDEVSVVTARLFNHFPSGIDPAGTNPFVTIQWRQREPAVLPKVAFRWDRGAVIDQGNHGVTGLPGQTIDLFEIRHFPYRSTEQFVQKARNGAAAYAATNLPDDAGAHWRGYGTILDRYGVEALEDVFREHFWFLSPADSGLVLNPAPWLRWR